MNRALADQVKLFHEQAEARQSSLSDATAYFDLDDQIAFGIFLFDRLRQLDERFRLHGAQDPEMDAEILRMYRQWGEAANNCLRTLAELESKGFRFHSVAELRQRCQEARGVLATEMACVPPAKETPKKESLEELLLRVTDENLHAEVDFGPPVGKEVW